MKKIQLISAILSIVMCVSCSSKTNFLFQRNDPEPQYRLFDLLDDYPALSDAFSNINQTTFNQLLADTVNQNIEGTIDILKVTLQGGVIPDKVTELLAIILPLMDRIMHQEQYSDPNDEYTNYTDDFYSFLDELSKTGSGASGEIVDIIGKAIGYLYYVHGDEIETIMDDLNAFLTDSSGTQTLKTSLPLINEAMGKLLLRCNESIQVDGKDTGLGNAVDGIDALLSGINAIATKDPVAREALYDVISELGNVMVSKVNDKDFARVLKELMTNLAEFTTEGGMMMANNNYCNDDDTYYVNMELRNALREMWPSLVSMMIAAKGYWEEDAPDYSIIHDALGRSPIQLLTEQLYNLKLNCNIDLSNYGLEDSLKQMVMYNGYGQLRSSSTYKISYLDHLLFTLILSNDFGFKTYLGYHENEPYRNGIQEDTDCLIHSHGIPTGGILTVNDSLYAMTAGAKYVYQYDLVEEYLGAYELSLDPPVTNYRYTTKSGRTLQGQYIYRSSFPFTSNDVSTGNYNFYMGYDYPVLLLMNGFSVGDAGIPNGGYTGIHPETDSTGDDETVNDYRTYYPYVGNGLGELNTGAWVMGWIARACFEGEGPYYYAPTNPYTKIIGGKLYYIYFRPDGRYYAFVWKPDVNDPSSWEYFYPYDGGNDVKDETNTIGSGTDLYYARLNHYQAEWETDKYILKADFANNEQIQRYYTLNRVVGSEGKDKYLFHKINDPVNKNDDIDAGVASGLPAGSLVFKEKIPEKTSIRECKSQEEAMYRNLQWLLLEKKIVVIMPMRAYIYVHAGDLSLDPLAVAVIEANGVYGMVNLKKGTDVGYWVLKGDEGLGNAGCTGKDMNNNTVNYGDSYIPGDGRIMLFVKEDAGYLLGGIGDSVTLDTIWNEILGSAPATPAILAKNLAPIARLAFIKANNLIESTSSKIGNESDVDWQNRNKLVPIIAALASSLHQASYYKTPNNQNDHWYNFAEKSKHKYPLRSLRPLLAMLANPYFKYFKQPYSGATTGVWVPQIQNEGGKGSFAYLSPDITGYEDVDFKPKQDLRSMAQLLIENTPNSKAACDGLIPLLSNTKIVSTLLGFLQNIGAKNGVYADTDVTSNMVSKWGAGRRIAYGLEQIVTSIKASKGIAYQNGYTSSVYPEWMFTKRDVDIDLDIALDEIIGADSIDKGLAVFVDHRNPNHPNYIEGYTWNNYYKLMWGIGELMSTKGFTNGNFCINEDIIRLLDSTLTKFEATDAQLKGLRHTLGLLFTYYDNNTEQWIEAGELTQLLTETLPDLMNVYRGHNLNLLRFASILLEDGGFADYFITNLHTDYPTKQVMEELYAFLSDDDAIVGIANPDSLLWSDLHELLIGFVDLMEYSNANKSYRAGFEELTKPVYLSASDYLYSSDFDPYSGLGWVLSKK